MQFLDWFIKEQGEEETNANDLISKMELFGSDPKSRRRPQPFPHRVTALTSSYVDAPAATAVAISP